MGIDMGFDCLLVVMFLLNEPTVRSSDGWKQLAPLPNTEGFAGPFVGVSGGSLLIAGGANFPTLKPSEGGEKKWYDSIWRLTSPGGTWLKIGELPRPLGYGVSITYKDSLLCIGGSNTTGHFSDVFRISITSEKTHMERLAPLPIPLANAAGSLVGDVIYIAGGQDSPSSRTTLGRVFRLGLSDPSPRWEEIPSWPGPSRMLAVAATLETSFWIIGGVDLVDGTGSKPTRRYLNDVYRYEPSTGWKRLPDLPTPLAAAPSPAPLIDGSISLLGGDEGTDVNTPHDRHPGFSRRMVVWNQKEGRWEAQAKLPFATVTTTAALWQNAWIVPTGEVFPGIRTPAIWTRAASP